ncbi:hypothetical protein CTheo_6218 [Ceratobasidium theobromae]|uniref:Pectate lyase n=1 Tax=Ceratobasidium theobromae TaxID=1582974 RepID=A0A5N5QFS3_9AGAM|nr:hypothetical protein CTheo_6218 [Ceratobasidium theobromae]
MHQNAIYKPVQAKHFGQQIHSSIFQRTAKATYLIMVQISLTALVAFVGTLAHFAVAAPSGSPAEHDKRAANCNFPNPPASSNVRLNSPRVIGKYFNGGGRRYGRGVRCNDKTEHGQQQAVFVLEAGATLENAVIGADANEGVHCNGPCTLRNVWFEDVCEDGVTFFQKSGISFVYGGGSKNAVDKVFQHNGGGKVFIDSFCAIGFGTFYRSCGNCPTQVKREVEIQNVIARNGRLLAGMNSNYGDLAIIRSNTNQLTNVNWVCNSYIGNNRGAASQPSSTNQRNGV